MPCSCHAIAFGGLFVFLTSVVDLGSAASNADQCAEKNSRDDRCCTSSSWSKCGYGPNNIPCSICLGDGLYDGEGPKGCAGNGRPWMCGYDCDCGPKCIEGEYISVRAVQAVHRKKSSDTTGRPQECELCPVGKYSFGEDNDKCDAIAWRFDHDYSHYACEHKCRFGLDPSTFKANLKQGRKPRCAPVSDLRVYPVEDFRCGNLPPRNELERSCTALTGPYLDGKVTGPPKCEQCDGSPMYLYKSNCWARCPAGTFGTTTNDAACTLICKPVNKKCKSDGEYSVAEPTASSDRVCHECHGDCASCTGPDPWQCLECPNNREKHSDGAADRPGICFSKRCGEGMYATEAGACVACDNSCATCSGKQKDQCISCTDNTFLHVNVTGKFCVPTCPDYYGVLGPEGGSSRSCKRCDKSKCTACAGLASHCTSCRGRELGQKYLLNGRCIETCPDGFYAAGSITDGFVCERCLDPCRTCRPNQNDFCLSCLEGFFLHEEGTLLEGKCVGSCALGHQAIMATPTPATTTTTPTAITTSAAPPTDACACKDVWVWNSVTYEGCSLPHSSPAGDVVSWCFTNAKCGRRARRSSAYGKVKHPSRKLLLGGLFDGDDFFGGLFGDDDDDGDDDAPWKYCDITPAPQCGDCKDDDFKCVSGTKKCIPKKYVCNGTPDCADGSDEFCPDETPTLTSMYRREKCHGGAGLIRIAAGKNFNDCFQDCSNNANCKAFSHAETLDPEKCALYSTTITDGRCSPTHKNPISEHYIWYDMRYFFNALHALGERGGSCNECSPGTFSAVQHSFADCQPCPKGMYEPNSGSTKCTSCPKGTATTTSKSTTLDACEECRPGTVQTVEGGECTPCNPGTYNPNAKTFGYISDGCNECNVNEFQPSEGQRACISCPPGQFQPDVGQSSCLECSSTCSECIFEANNCLSCNPPFFAKGSSGCVDRSECGGKEYEDEASRSCRDHTAPIFHNCPRNQTRYAWGPNQNGTVADWRAPDVTDDADTNITALSNQKPGWFLIGTTEVSYVAVDASGNEASCNFHVEVIHGNRSSCTDSATRQRRAEEERHVHEFSADVDFFNKDTNERLKLKSKGEYVHGLITLVSKYFVESAACSETDLVLTLGLDATMDEQEQVLHEWSDRNRIIAVEDSWGCIDETGKVGPVYRRIDVGGVVALSTHPLQVQLKTTNATFVDCFRHANVDFDYFPGNATLPAPVRTAPNNSENVFDSQPFNGNANTPRRVQEERHRHRQRRAWGLAWQKDNRCFLGICKQIGYNWDFAEQKPINPAMMLTSTAGINIACNDCFAFMQAGVRLKYVVGGKLIPKLELFHLSIYGEMRAKMNLDAKMFYSTFEYERELFDTGELLGNGYYRGGEKMGLSYKIPLAPRDLLGLEFTASLSLQLSGKIEIEVDGEGKLQARLEFHRYYEKGVAWTPDRGFYKVAPHPIKKTVFEVEDIKIPDKIRVRIYPVIPQLTLELGGFLYVLKGLVKGGVTVPIIMRLEPYFEMELDHTPESQCELQVSTYMGLDYNVFIRGIFAKVEMSLLGVVTLKRWDWEVLGRKDLNGAILPKTKISSGGLGCKRRLVYEWRVGDWSPCLATEETRDVTCTDMTYGLGEPMADFYCKSVRPQHKKPCVFDCYLAGCGSGECLEDGKCQCDFGWTFPRGNNDVGQCIRPVCRDTCIYGICSNPDTCTCDEGWTGPTCAEKIDATESKCPDALQCVNGYGCADTMGCICQRGWTHALNGACTVELVDCNVHSSPPDNCQICTSDPTKCADCQFGFALVGGACKASSPVANPDVQLFCDKTCDTCDGAGVDRCRSCREGDFFYGGRCLEGACPEGMAPSPDDIGKCAFCHSSCKRCSSVDAADCTACNDGLFFLDGAGSGAGSCVNECPQQGFWADSTSATCKQCNSACATCTGSAETDCTSCFTANDEVALYDGSCIALPCPPGTMLSPPFESLFYAGGNVCMSNTFNGPEPSCSFETCPLHWRGDGECDAECNTDACGYDRGDCTTDSDFCSALTSCNNCQSYGGCGWCESTMQCHSSAVGDSTSLAEIGMCPTPLLYYSCTAISVEPQLQFSNELEVRDGNDVVWSAGGSYIVQWTGGLKSGSVRLKFTVENDQMIDYLEATMFNPETAETLPNTGSLHVNVPDNFPSTCQLQFLIISTSDESNIAFSSHIVVNQSSLTTKSLRRSFSGRSELLLSAWSATEWNQCSQTCGSGSRTRVVKCLAILGGAEMPAADCDGAPPSLVQKCNVHRCPISELRIVHPKHTSIWHPSAPYDISFVGGEDYRSVTTRVREKGSAAWQLLECNTSSATPGLLIADAATINGMLAVNVTVELEVEVSVTTDVQTEVVHSEPFGLCSHVGPEGQCSFVDFCGLKQPCKNGGTCTNTPSSFACTCKPGFEGPTCMKYENNVDCPGGGVFHDSEGMCVCPVSTVCAECMPAYNPTEKTWRYYYPTSCAGCECKGSSSSSSECSPLDCNKANNPAAFCNAGECSCMKGYRKDTGAQKDNCILDISLEPALEPWQIGNQVTIRWIATGNSPMRIELIRPGYGHFAVAPSAPNSGVFNWKIPHSLAEGSYRLSITADYDWRSRVGTNIRLINREEDRHPCCIVAPSASDTVQVGSLTRIVWTPAKANHAGQRKRSSTGTQLELEFHASNGNVTSIATGIEDGGSFVAKIPAINEFAATNKPFVRGRFCLFSSTASKTCGDVVLIDSPPASIAILNGVEDEAIHVARNSTQELVWKSVGLARAPCDGSTPSSCQLTILTIVDGMVVGKIENVSNFGSYLLQTPTSGEGRLEVRIFASAERQVWDQQLLGNLTELASIDGGISGDGGEATSTINVSAAGGGR